MMRLSSLSQSEKIPASYLRRALMTGMTSETMDLIKYNGSAKTFIKLKTNELQTSEEASGKVKRI